MFECEAQISIISFSLVKHSNHKNVTCITHSFHLQSNAQMHSNVTKTLTPTLEHRYAPFESKRGNTRVQRIVELRANGLHVHVRSVISGITPFVDLFVNLESLRAIPLLHTEEKRRKVPFSHGESFLFRTCSAGTESWTLYYGEEEEKSHDICRRETRGRYERFEKSHYVDVCSFHYLSRILQKMLTQDLARVCLYPCSLTLRSVLSMWWDTEMAAVVLEVLTVENSNIAEAAMSSSPSSHKAERRSRRGTAVMMKLVEEWSLPNWNYVVTLSSIMVRGARQSSSSSDDGVGVLNIRGVEAEMGSGEYALKEKDASVHVGVSEADFSVMFNDKETRMIELKSLAVFTTCAFMNQENVAIGDVQLFEICRVDLISASLLPFFQGFPLL